MRRARVLFGASLALASAAAHAEPDIDLQHMRPSGMVSGFAATFSGRQLGALDFSLEVSGGYAWRPLQGSVEVPGGLARDAGAMDHLAAIYGRAAFAPTDWLEIAVGAPIVQFATLGPAWELWRPLPSKTTGFGDLDIQLGFRPTTEEKHGVGLTITPFVSAPTGTDALSLSRGTPTFGGRLALSGVARPVHVAGHVGYRVALGHTLVQPELVADDQLEYGVGVGFLARGEIVRFNLESFGQTTVGPGRASIVDRATIHRDHTSIEVGGSLGIRSPTGLAVMAGGWAGVTSSPGTPGARAWLGIGYVPVAASDPDGDGLLGKRDLCPDVPEDLDGRDDSDGCPDLDDDGDGVLLPADRCPDAPEDLDQYRDDDGCPDPDNDGDGIDDPVDRCPLDPEDRDGFEDADGCPEYENDGDGIPDDRDICRDDPEDFDGFKDEDGCPDRDNDRDRILDIEDACPDEPEDRDRFEDGDGCPEPDNDGDGVLDVTDDCPNEPEDNDGFSDDDGCPEADGDADADGILDAADACPDEPEDFDGHQDEDGCRDPDNDGDAILDPEDLCPDEPEVYNGVNDEDGCPDETLAVVSGDHIVIFDRIYFAFGEARILPESFPVLTAVAQTINTNPAVWRVRVEGHTDDVGTEGFNQTLSDARARAVVDWLVGHGVAPERLVGQGFGELFPVDTNRTPEGRELNRRVEFVLLDSR